MKDVKGFLKTKGSKLINEDGNEVLLKGVGLGGWFLPEGYMWCFPDSGDRPWKMERMIEELLGTEKAREFWENYYNSFISEEDIKQIAAEGFNSIRLPINSRHIIKDGEEIGYEESKLKLIDRLINWCEKYNLYVILDLHGAPGGQTGTNIDDSQNNKPELFIKEENKQRTVLLWRKLAERYKDRWIVAGYDLLNEPLPNWNAEYNGQVMPLYKEIVKAIREVDKNHIIILEGVHWATDWGIFIEKPDENLMLEFHKYWNNPDTESIEGYLEKREHWKVPIFMGEGGENNLEWYTGAFTLYDDHNISWNFWTWKKMSTSNSPCSVKLPEHWEKLVAYLEGGMKPSKETAESILWEFLHNINFPNCEYHPEVVRSLFRRVPVLIPAAFYGHKGNGISFRANNKANFGIEFRFKDNIKLQLCDSAKTKPNFEHGRGQSWQEDEWLYVKLFKEEWLAYEVEVIETKEVLYSIAMQLSMPNKRGRIIVLLDDTKVGFIENSGEAWETIALKHCFYLKPGKHKLVIKAEENEICVKWIEVKLCKEC